MMLSRVADSLYWIGRYVERAENVSRFLLVTSELSAELEGLDEALAQREWDDLLQAVPGAAGASLDFSPATRFSVPYLNWLLLDADNAYSVFSCLARARENVRGVREALTREVFLHLNECYRELDERRRRRLRDPVVGHDLAARTHRDILTTLGAMENTLSRDEGWTFMKLGESMERTLRTLLVLRAKLPGLLADPEGTDVPLLYARWRSLLRMLASLENYRRVHGAGLVSERVVRFLLFDRLTPRSVCCGVARMQGYLRQLPGSEPMGEAPRVVGRLQARLTFEDDRIMANPDPKIFCDEIEAQLGLAHEALSRQYFPG